MGFNNPFDYPRPDLVAANGAGADAALPSATYTPARFGLFRGSGERLSLFGEILDWMLIPLLLIWPMSTGIAYLSTQSLAGQPFDRALDDHVDAVARQLVFRQGSVGVDLPPQARNVLRADDIDDVYFQVLGARGEFVSGEREFPLPQEYEREALGASTARAGVTHFRDDIIGNQEVRVAYRYVPLDSVSPTKVSDARFALVQVAETLGKRVQLANELIKSVILAQFVIVPVAVIMLWFGLTQGIAPLNELRQRIGRRKPNDLSPMSARDVPEEIRPLIGSINDLMQRLGTSLKGQQRFIADAAHQMRTPLAGLKMQAEFAVRQVERVPLEGKAGEPGRELKLSLEHLVASTSRATHMVNQLLSLTRAESPTGHLAESTSVSLNSIVMNVAQQLYPRAQAKEIDLGIELEEGGDAVATVQGNAILLGEMVSNLIDNAIRYTPPHGMVTARVVGHQASEKTTESGQSRGRVIVDIEDSGVGIPEEERDVVFERFYRGREINDNALGNSTEGSGLGLPIVREIAAKHRARVQILSRTSALGAPVPGTLFRVIFQHQSVRGFAFTDKS